jgi:hypothetical protein
MLKSKMGKIAFNFLNKSKNFSIFFEIIKHFYLFAYPLHAENNNRINQNN